jgi:hypothetical protein
MIPPFDSNGYLPPGIYEATLAQIEKNYTYNLRRKWLFEGLTKLVKTLKTAGCKTLYLNGSYITNKLEPNDYDAVWEYEGVDNTIDPLIRDGLDNITIKRKYGGDIFCHMPKYFNYIEYFQTDWRGIPKGIIRIDLEK